MIPGLHWWSRFLLGLVAIAAFYILSISAQALAIRRASFLGPPSPFFTLLSDLFFLAIFASPIVFWLIDPLVALSRSVGSAIFDGARSPLDPPAVN